MLTRTGAPAARRPATGEPCIDGLDVIISAPTLTGERPRSFENPE